MKAANSYQLKSLPPGRGAIRATLEAMARLVNTYKTDPTIFELSRRLVRDLPRGDQAWGQEVAAMLNFVRRNVRYTHDVGGVETLQSPVQTLRLKTGDCDDMSTLLGTLLATINHPVKFVAVGFQKNSLSHVYVETPIARDKWVALETIKNWPIGKAPRGVRDRMEHRVKW